MGRRCPLLDPVSHHHESVVVTGAGNSKLKRSLSSKVSPQPRQPLLRRTVSWHPDVVDHTSQSASRAPTTCRVRQASPESLSSPPAVPEQTPVNSEPRRRLPRRPHSTASADAFAPTHPLATPTYSPSHRKLHPSPPQSPSTASTASVSSPPPSSEKLAQTKRVRKPKGTAETKLKTRSKSKARYANSHCDPPTKVFIREARIDTTAEEHPHDVSGHQQQPPTESNSRRDFGSTLASIEANPPFAPTSSAAITAPNTRRRRSHQPQPHPRPPTTSRNLAILWQVDHIQETTSPYAWPLELFSPHKYSRSGTMLPVPVAVEAPWSSNLSKPDREKEEDNMTGCAPSSPVMRCGSILRVIVGGSGASGKKKDAKSRNE
ncbi:hypothetical protein BCR44DRAFT_1442239 [Catenaria anguillulae PL171]|uniref:Uncharacterized protein n=1 Tax=Catenaria anguillulae PL171 TaxID=765915 RepID=A0A1Y2H9Y4_9FUNG|nr:hypothetical protein BCR44DRAFT_1442239 [Catenaria anguillulae PL171]